MDHSIKIRFTTDGGELVDTMTVDSRFLVGNLARQVLLHEVEENIRRALRYARTARPGSAETPPSPPTFCNTCGKVKSHCQDCGQSL